MKMKKFTVGFSILAASAMFILGCGKKTPNVAPEEDTEVQSAIDATWATYVITDLDMICSFAGENLLLNHFYTPVPPSLSPGNGTFTAIRDISAQYLFMAWNQTKCLDGRLRDGTVNMNYSINKDLNQDADQNSYYYRVPGFTGELTLSEYKVDGWLVQIFNTQFSAYVYNRLSEYNWKPATTDLVWEISGKFKFTHPTDSTRNMVWDGKIMKTLENTQDPKVFSPKKDAAITWSLASVSYNGDIRGLTSGNVPYKMHIEATRDFTCSPDKIEAVGLTNTVGVLAKVDNEHHPFVSGIASFSTSNSHLSPAELAQLHANISLYDNYVKYSDKPGSTGKYPRQIYFGNEGNAALSAQCDNSAEVLIKGISYRIDLIK
jgi:hypothetical protein